MQRCFDHENAKCGAAEEPHGDVGDGQDGCATQERHGMGTGKNAGRFQNREQEPRVRRVKKTNAKWERLMTLF
jgi:hypothetical protein